MLDIEGVAARLRISTATVRRLVRKGDLRAYRIGGQLRFKPEEVDAYVAAQVVAPGDVETAASEDRPTTP